MSTSYAKMNFRKKNRKTSTFRFSYFNQITDSLIDLYVIKEPA